eukprot:gnl/Spiro4/29448_TR14424_c0_g1_i1.p1 gnl/Spiro4/29448_TR14424_c0_g1~~gnl/Spiro4/29448_TR14424_c0_g1_i1.p1  ORF type:complete len:734 (+),score=178.90 gnl/Spiro4/29448_TR14424_c0_g1_i1:66-2204(+)
MNDPLSDCGYGAFSQFDGDLASLLVQPSGRNSKASSARRSHNSTPQLSTIGGGDSAAATPSMERMASSPLMGRSAVPEHDRTSPSLERRTSAANVTLHGSASCSSPNLRLGADRGGRHSPQSPSIARSRSENKTRTCGIADDNNTTCLSSELTFRHPTPPSLPLGLAVSTATATTITTTLATTTITAAATTTRTTPPRATPTSLPPIPASSSAHRHRYTPSPEPKRQTSQLHNAPADHSTAAPATPSTSTTTTAIATSSLPTFSSGGLTLAGTSRSSTPSAATEEARMLREALVEAELNAKEMMTEISSLRTSLGREIEKAQQAERAASRKLEKKMSTERNRANRADTAACRSRAALNHIRSEVKVSLERADAELEAQAATLRALSLQHRELKADVSRLRQQSQARRLRLTPRRPQTRELGYNEYFASLRSSHASAPNPQSPTTERAPWRCGRAPFTPRHQLLAPAPASPAARTATSAASASASAPRRGRPSSAHAGIDTDSTVACCANQSPDISPIPWRSSATPTGDPDRPSSPTRARAAAAAAGSILFPPTTQKKDRVVEWWCGPSAVPTQPNTHVALRPHRPAAAMHEWDSVVHNAVHTFAAPTDGVLLHHVDDVFSLERVQAHKALKSAMVQEKLQLNREREAAEVDRVVDTATAVVCPLRRERTPVERINFGKIGFRCWSNDPVPTFDTHTAAWGDQPSHFLRKSAS